MIHEGLHSSVLVLSHTHFSFSYLSLIYCCHFGLLAFHGFGRAQVRRKLYGGAEGGRMNQAGLVGRFKARPASIRMDTPMQWLQYNYTENKNLGTTFRLKNKVPCSPL
jgi:hypothetical protein